MNNPTIDNPAEKTHARIRPRWKGAHSIQLAHQLNERCFELLSELATSEPFGNELPGAVNKNRHLWRDLSTDSRRRLAALPFVIVDVRFTDELWWRALGKSPASVSIAGHPLPRERCAELLLETLMFAWQAAREDSRIAQMIFAMTRPVARIIATLAMREISALAQEQTSCLRIRWSENTLFWRELLDSARGEDAVALEDARLHAKLLFCGDLNGARAPR
jgi:hypothetical protein